MSNSKDFKKKRKVSSVIMLISIVLCLAVIASLAVLLFDARQERNPDNLITVNDTYLKDTKTNYGLDIDVDEDGVIKIDGDSTKNELLTVQTLTLPAGVYTLSGIKEPNLAKMYLSANWGEGNVAYAGLENDTFTLTKESVVSILLYVEGSDGGKTNIANANKTIEPVLVKGESVGDFYK